MRLTKLQSKSEFGVLTRDGSALLKVGAIKVDMVSGELSSEMGSSVHWEMSLDSLPDILIDID